MLKKWQKQIWIQKMIWLPKLEIPASGSQLLKTKQRTRIWLKSWESTWSESAHIVYKPRHVKRLKMCAKLSWNWNRLGLELEHMKSNMLKKKLITKCQTARALAQLAGSPALRALLRKSRGKSLASIGHLSSPEAGLPILCTVVPQCPSRPKFF